MKKNIFGFILFFLGNIFLLTGLLKLSKYDTDIDVIFSILFIGISIIEIILGIKLSFSKDKNWY